jgi:hypothetical protein
LELPAIMKWIKQTFAQRYNRLMGWIGHIWGDRYWSQIMEGDPPEGASGRGGGAAPNTTRVRPRYRKRERGPRFSAASPLSAASPPG